MNRKSNGLIDLSDIDPAISATISSGRQRQADRSLTPAQRKKRQTDKARVKTTYDLPADLSAEIHKVAAILETSDSQVAALLLITALQGINDDWMTFAGYERSWSRSPRFKYAINLPPTPEVVVEKIK